MTGQVFLLCAWQALGTLWLAALGRRLGIAYACVAGFLLGVAIWVTLALGVTAAGVPFRPDTMGGMAAVLLLVPLLLQAAPACRLSPQDWVCWGVSVIAAAGTGVAFTVFNYSVPSFDSFFHLFSALQIADTAGLDSLRSTSAIYSYPIFVPMVHATASLLGAEYLVAFQPVFGVSFLATFYVLSRRAIGTVVGKGRVPRALSLLTTLGLATTAFVLFLSVYIGNNLVAAAYVLIAAVGMWLAASEGNARWLVPVLLALAALVLSRMEGVLVGMTVLGVMSALPGLSARQRAVVGFGFVAAAAAWCGYLLAASADQARLPGSIILHPRYIRWVLVLLALLVLALALQGFGWMRALWSRSHLLILGTFAVAIGVLAVMRGENVAASFVALLFNMLKYGRWEPAWLVVMILFGLTASMPRFERQGPLLALVGALLLLILALGSVRAHPYRLNWGDSGNRMLITVFPLALIYLQLKLAAAQAVRPEASPPSSGD